MRIFLKVSTTFAVLTAIVGFSLVTGASRASADGGPHGNYTSTGGADGGLPDQCAGCHRVHQGKSVGKLLKANSPYALCLTCHNGQGSRLDVFDGVKLAATVTPNAAVVRSVDSASLNVSVAPAAVLSAPQGIVVDTPFTLAIRNRTASPVTTTVTIASETNVGVGTTQFTASTLANLANPAVTQHTLPTVVVPAAVSDVPGVAYLDVITHSKSTNTAGTTNLTTVRVTLGSEVPEVVIQTLIGTNSATVLNGGGFMYVDSKAITSRHNADPADDMRRPWGFNGSGTGSGGTSSNTGQNNATMANPLQCTSCHNPHGTTNYRLLKESVNGNTVNVKAWYNGAATVNEGARGLESGAPADKYTQNYYGSAGTGGAPTATTGSLSSLCGACHTAYPSAGASSGYTAGGVTHYRHKTEMPFTDWSNPDTARVSSNPETSPITGFPALRLASMSGAGAGSNNVVTCLTCHRVHGTSTTMSGYALKISGGGLGDADLTPSQAPTYDPSSTSTLLYTNNRGMCQACHQWGVTP